MPPPLLTFPPPPPPVHYPSTPFTSTSFSSSPPKKQQRSTFYKILSTLPLLFIFSILFFTFYTFFISLVVSYLLIQQGEKFRSLIYSLIFFWFFGGCLGGVGQAVLKGGGRTGDIIAQGSRGNGRREDEESRMEEEEVEGLLFSSNSNDEEEDYNQDDSEGLTSNKNVNSRNEITLGSIQLKQNGTKRYCTKCSQFKPDRTHHCSTCGSCSLKMDHHCPWLGQACVGYRNYKFFLLFLWYGGLLGIYCALVMLFELGRFVENGPENFELAPISWALLLLLGFIFGISLTFFGLYHFYLACNNITTIEAMESGPSYSFNHPPSASSSSNRRYKQDHELTRKERKRLEKAKRRLNVYDLGRRKNLAQIFGGWERKWLWIVPFGEPPGDGHSFPINRENLEKLRRITEEICLVHEVPENIEEEDSEQDIEEYEEEDTRERR